MDRHAAKDEVTICRGDLCNDQPIDPARYCVDPLREVGVGRLAAKIIQSTAERTHGGFGERARFSGSRGSFWVAGTVFG